MQTRFDYYRLVAAYLAAGISLAIVVMQGHVHIDVSNPATYLSPLEHKCGLLMLACAVWLMIEGVRLATSPDAFGPVRANR